MSALNGWQPIETAPRDGTRGLLYWPSYAYNLGEVGEPKIAIGWWTENRRIAQNDEGGLSAEYFHDTDRRDDYGLALPEHAPTHWQPLPPPPVSP